MNASKSQTIFRHTGNSKVTVLNNSMLRDKRLSLEARGLLAIILSLPANWDFLPCQLMKEQEIGRDRLYRILKELIEHGYCERNEVRNEAGQHSGIAYVFHGVPRTAEPCPEKPDAGNKDSIKRERDKGIQKERLSSGKPDVCVGKADSFEEEFEVWYQAYPRHVGRGQALKAYCSARRKKNVAPATLLEEAQKAAERYAKTEQRYIPHPATWLNGERWLDEPERAKPAEQAKMPDWWRELIAPALEQDIDQIPLFGGTT